MVNLKRWMFACCALLVFSPVAAQSTSPADVAAVPIGSPVEWFDPEDYPKAAMRFKMAGMTAFAIKVDPAGKPVRCDIVASSGFDILDHATCERAMAKARFAPPKDAKGKSAEGIFRSRVRWVLPQGAVMQVAESYATVNLVFDQEGKISSCRATLHIPAMAADNANVLCASDASRLAYLGSLIREKHKAPTANVMIQQATVFSPDLRAQVLSAMPGYELLGLSIYRFSVTKEGKLGQCSYEEQRGMEEMADEFCSHLTDSEFDPPFSALDKNGIAGGWFITRIMLKSDS